MVDFKKLFGILGIPTGLGMIGAALGGPLGLLLGASVGFTADLLLKPKQQNPEGTNPNV
jgi:hypothetical protein